MLGPVLVIVLVSPGRLWPAKTRSTCCLLALGRFWGILKGRRIASQLVDSCPNALLKAADTSPLLLPAWLALGTGVGDQLC